MRYATGLCVVLVAVVAATAAAPARAATTYAVIGDTPYSTFQIQHFPDDIGEINADPDVSLVMHLGDIKSGSTGCDTSAYMQIKADFDLFADPLVYTPGDNEWADCHRPVEGGFNPLERLQTLRSIFFANPGREAEPGYPENVTWSQARVQFGTLNIPGSNNDWLPWFGTARTREQIDEVTNRTAADVAWIKHVFNRAKASRAKAVVIAVQADMWKEAAPGKAAQSNQYRPIVQALARRALWWRKPVLMFSGDPHVFSVSRPLLDPTSARNRLYGMKQPVWNVKLITTNGGTTPCHQWLKLRIDPKSKRIFSWQRIPFANQDLARNRGC